MSNDYILPDGSRLEKNLVNPKAPVFLHPRRLSTQPQVVPFVVTDMMVKPCLNGVEVQFRNPRGSRHIFAMSISSLHPILVWVGATGTNIVDVRSAFSFGEPEPAPKPAPKFTGTCPTCYGTGFFKGFGAPCSKGCKAP